MLLAILSMVIWNISKVFYKKTTEYNIHYLLNELFSHIWAIIWIILIIFLWEWNFFMNSYFDYILVIISFCLFLTEAKLSQLVIRKEKLSTLIPYENIWKIVTVLWGVFILWDEISNISLLIFLFIVFMILLFSVNLKTLNFSWNIILYIFSKTCSAVWNIIAAYIIISNTAINYYIVYVFTSLLLTFILCSYKGILKDTKWLDKSYYKSRVISSFGWIWWVLTLLLIMDLWISITTLLWFLWIIVSLITWYIVFKDIPTKKDIILTIIVTSGVAIAFYLK